DLDPATKLVLDKGARNVEILKQPQYAPVPVEKQVAIIYLGTQGLLRNVPVKRIKEFEEHFLLEMENKLPDVMAEFKKGNLPDDGMKKIDRKSTRLNSSHVEISYAVFCLKKKKKSEAKHTHYQDA